MDHAHQVEVHSSPVSCRQWRCFVQQPKDAAAVGAVAVDTAAAAAAAAEEAAGQ
jgi:prephenate dehydratase